MGQLEKYGLYVLCLVIFLILGVTIWGGGDLPPPGKNSTAAIKAPAARPDSPPLPRDREGRAAAEHHITHLQRQGAEVFVGRGSFSRITTSM